jgi:hypothetical protein
LQLHQNSSQHGILARLCSLRLIDLLSIITCVTYNRKFNSQKYYRMEFNKLRSFVFVLAKMLFSVK